MLHASYSLILLILSSIGLDFGNRNFLWHLRGWTWPPAPRGGTGPGRSSAPDCKGKKNYLTVELRRKKYTILAYTRNVMAM
jgi:hypothetical protein